MQQEVARPLELFVSFAEADRALKDELLKHLSVLQKFAHIEHWNMDDVRPGENRMAQLRNALQRADIAILLLSADFLAADLANDVELPALFQKREDQGLRVLPVLLKSCLWKYHPWLGELVPIPKHGAPILSLAGDDREAAMTEIAAEVLASRSLPDSLQVPSPNAMHAPAEPVVYNPPRTASRSHTPRRKSHAIVAGCAICAVAAGTVYALSSTSYEVHGQLWDVRAKAPIAGAEILLVGPPCRGGTATTSDTGQFELRCTLKPFITVINPRVRIRLPGEDAYCPDAVPILPENVITIIEMDEACVMRAVPASPTSEPLDLPLKFVPGCSPSPRDKHTFSMDVKVSTRVFERRRDSIVTFTYTIGGTELSAATAPVVHVEIMSGDTVLRNVLLPTKQEHGVYSFGWDGSYNGSPVAPGAYRARITATDASSDHSIVCIAPVMVRH